MVIFHSYFEIIISLFYVLYYLCKKFRVDLVSGYAFVGNLLILHGCLKSFLFPRVLKFDYMASVTLFLISYILVLRLLNTRQVLCIMAKP